MSCHHKSIAILVFYISMFVALAISDTSLEFAHLHFLDALIGTFCIFAWFVLDTEVQGYKASAILKISMIACAAIALPYYLIRTRNVKSLTSIFLRLCAYTLATFLASYTLHAFILNNLW
jgi:hypothetical protein